MWLGQCTVAYTLHKVSEQHGYVNLVTLYVIKTPHIVVHLKGGVRQQFKVRTIDMGRGLGGEFGSSDIFSDIVIYFTSNIKGLLTLI